LVPKLPGSHETTETTVTASLFPRRRRDDAHPSSMRPHPLRNRSCLFARTGVFEAGERTLGVENQVAEYLRKFPFQDTYDYAMKYTQGILRVSAPPFGILLAGSWALKAPRAAHAPETRPIASSPTWTKPETFVVPDMLVRWVTHRVCPLPSHHVCTF